MARSRYRVRGVPANFLIDREGQIIHQSVGFSAAHAAEFETRLANALAGG